MVVVEVRQGTLGVDGHGWGPAGHTDVDGRGWGPAENTVDRGSQLDEEDEEDDEEDDEEEEERRRGREEEEQATDIKSNNPHLAGGEQTPNTQPKLDSVIVCLMCVVGRPLDHDSYSMYLILWFTRQVKLFDFTSSEPNGFGYLPMFGHR